MRLGSGELTMHFRRHVEGGPKQRIECGAPSGCITAVIEDVTCVDCKAIARQAAFLADQCGCRRPEVHTGRARAQREIAGHWNKVPPRMTY